MDNELKQKDVVNEQKAVVEGQKKTEVMAWIRDVVILIIIVILFLNFGPKLILVDGDSMNPTLEDGNCVLINQLIYRFKAPKQSDIIIFPFEGREGAPFVKRIIGIPNDTIDIKDGFVYVNGEKLEEDYLDAPTDITGDVKFPFTVPEGEYFVLGDNRAVSFDSRYSKVGTISRQDIIGKVSIRIWPFLELGSIY